MNIDFRIFCIFYLGIKVEGHVGQGQRSHWPDSNEGPNERQVGSHQRQVASFLISLGFSLQKGGGYHLDLFLIALQIGICSVLGLPWFVAATVLSINHVRSLTMESDASAPGEKPKFLGIR